MWIQTAMRSHGPILALLARHGHALAFGRDEDDMDVSAAWNGSGAVQSGGMRVQ